MARILIIDDSEVFRMDIREILVAHEVIEATDGIDGLSKLKAGKSVELIICDVNLPNMDGVAFCKKKAEMPEFKDIPILMVTTESNAELKKEVKAYGVKAWVLKPVEPQSLVHGVQLLLSQKK